MSNGASVALAAKKRLRDDAVTLFAGERVQVSFGHPGQNREFDDIVALTGIRTEQDSAGMGNARTRREHLYLTVMVSCWRAGATDDLSATEAVYSYANRLEQHIRTTDPTLGGLALWCFLDEHTSDGLTDRQMLARGRLIEGAFIFHALANITGAAA